MKIILILSLVFVTTLPGSWAADGKVSLRFPGGAAEPHFTALAEDLDRLITIAHALEKAPFARGATVDREWALWVIDHDPAIFPSLSGKLPPQIEDSGPDWRVIYAQYILSFVCFQLEYPERRDDPTDVHK